MKPQNKRRQYTDRVSRKQSSLYSRTEDFKTRKASPKHFGGIGALLGIVLIFLSAYTVFFSDIFKVEEVVVADTKFVSRGEVESVVRANNNIFNQNVVTFGFWGIIGRIERIGGVSRVIVSRESLNKVVITIEEELPLLSWQTLGKKYLVDKTGKVWAEFEEKYQSLPIVIDTKNLPLSVGDRVLPQSFVSFFTDLVSEFTDESGANVVSYEVLDIVSDLKVTSDAGWYVVFDTTRSADGQLISLKRVLEEARIKNKKLEYIDLRINNRVFYK